MYIIVTIHHQPTNFPPGNHAVFGKFVHTHTHTQVPYELFKHNIVKRQHYTSLVVSGSNNEALDGQKNSGCRKKS